MPQLRTEQITKSYRGRQVLKSIDLEINDREIVGLLGPNGAGKTTTFYIVVGLTHPDSGRVFYNDEDILDMPMYLRAQKGISYLPQEPSVFRKLTVEENLLAIAETLNLTASQEEKLANDLLQEFGIAHLRKNKAYTLSGGERRRVEIARCLLLKPSFILLDEPFAGIDPLAVIDIQKLIVHLKSRGIGVVITDHNVRETLRITDRAYIIHEGRIFRNGTPQELAADEEVRRVYLGEHFQLL
ncbi:MAG TPA: LPS export ABC transporter ATP-binding protein [Acidobacteriota bacterium]|jgi:lipopolysaccharide export system ATP-binding protein|nr:LPS export ABC transporter ATP-binding protein [Acidobacteriota bacterium]HNR37946.1 LPS export ABC transporter ATP-binding protein [Acidobacteriota bacterium]HNU00388.1 LPS export ABC transporter ATP-binding protein [Acidobacteriota bacterium]HPB28083.1 LPS export ABC transporter ATP-binding protein [Acidobacteriota bacterium]HQO24660.1 LPS export ABC transporter ATP-binding protein [Acidobacteriota bacterium]